MPKHWAMNCLRGAAKHATCLEVLHHVTGLRGPGGGDSCRHQVRRGASGSQRTKRQLGHLAHTPDGVDVGFPVDRTAIMASTQDIATATRVIQTGMSKTDFETNAAKAAPATKPPIHHMAGIWSLGSSMSETSFAEEPPVKVLKMDFHDNARLPKASITINATPGQSNQPRGPSA